MPTELSIATVGARAAQLLRSRGDWAIAATFERSFYIQSGDAFVCLGDSSIGDGPLNAILASGVIQAFIAKSHPVPSAPYEPVAPWVPGTGSGMTAQGGRAIGQPSAVEQTIVLGGGQIVSWRGAGLWHADQWPETSSIALERSRLQAIVATAIAAAPPASFIHVVASALVRDPLTRRAGIGIAMLRTALAQASLSTCDAAAKALLGLGHGLTPSGDDVLAGALIAMHAVGRSEDAATLATSIRTHMRALTSPLSCALLEPACDGEPNAAVHRVVAALLTGATAEVVIAPLAGIGATSGFDLFAGILVAVEAGGAAIPLLRVALW